MSSHFSPWIGYIRTGGSTATGGKIFPNYSISLYGSFIFDHLLVLVVLELLVNTIQHSSNNV
jgi:hypothetical protein